MKSIYQQVMGSDFERLHPEIQKRFSLCSELKVASIGTGVMDRIWHGAAYTLPFLYVGTWRSIMFPEHGRNIPFTIRNYAYRDSLGRETVTWVRTFRTLKERRFDAYMIYSDERHCIVDYLGNHQHLAVDLDLSVAPNGGLRLRSGAQRFYEGPIAFNFPLFFSGIADVCEWYDDEEKRFHIDMSASNRTWGKLFGYSGSFEVSYIPADHVPPEILPRRVEARS